MNDLYAGKLISFTRLFLLFIPVFSLAQKVTSHDSIEIKIYTYLQKMTLEEKVGQAWRLNEINHNLLMGHYKGIINIENGEAKSLSSNPNYNLWH